VGWLTSAAWIGAVQTAGGGGGPPSGSGTVGWPPDPPVAPLPDEGPLLDAPEAPLPDPPLPDADAALLPVLCDLLDDPQPRASATTKPQAKEPRCRRNVMRSRLSSLVDAYQCPRGPASFGKVVFGDSLWR
jgi:hypothetical protein